ncbi:MAG: hypothetical protein KF819_12910 [Labilithrix sp.]|nr:hypothetical protein [Labilithrix sp.]
MIQRLVLVCVAFVVMTLAKSAGAQISETERKSAARAAYQEGVTLQEAGKYGDALQRFESAQKLFDAPTHLLHIAECQALTGRLVEASETYELLARKQLPPGSPDVFVQAQQQGQAELPALRARIPTLRVTTKPEHTKLQNLQVTINGVSMPTELLGIGRPLNPGTYRFTAVANGYATARHVDVPLPEKENKSVELVLEPRAGVAPAPVVVAPPPPAYQTGPNPQPYPDVRPREPKKDEPTSAGMLIGARAGVFIPAGDVETNAPMGDYATTGGGAGFDLYFRLAKMMLLGGTVEYASLGTPSEIPGLPRLTFDTSAQTTYFGATLGIIPNVDKVSFIGDLGIGSRAASQSLRASTYTRETTVRGLEFLFGVGVSIPAGPVRLVPKINISVGSFSSRTVVENARTDERDLSPTGRSVHAVFFIGLGGYYSLDFGSKPGASPGPAAASR